MSTRQAERLNLGLRERTSDDVVREIRVVLAEVDALLDRLRRS